jgi:hypothetical protein
VSTGAEFHASDRTSGEQYVCKLRGKSVRFFCEGDWGGRLTRATIIHASSHPKAFTMKVLTYTRRKTDAADKETKTLHT